MVASIAILQRPIAPTGVWSWVTTVDHKRIGILYGVSAIAFFILAGVAILPDGDPVFLLEVAQVVEKLP